MKIPPVPARPFHVAYFCLVAAPPLALLPALAFPGPPSADRVVAVTVIGAMLAWVPAAVVAGAAQGNRERPLVYWMALAGAVGLLLAFYGPFRLPRGDHPAASFAMMFFHFTAAAGALLTWAGAAFAHRLLRSESWRALVLALWVAAALLVPMVRTLHRLSAGAP